MLLGWGSFWKFLSRELGKKFLSTAHTLKTGIAVWHQTLGIPAATSKVFSHLQVTRVCLGCQWPDLGSSHLHYILAGPQPVIDLAKGLQCLETPTSTRHCNFKSYQEKLLISGTGRIVSTSFAPPTHPILVPLIHYWLQRQLLLLNFKLFNGLLPLIERTCRSPGKQWLRTALLCTVELPACSDRSMSDLWLERRPHNTKLPTSPKQESHFLGLLFSAGRHLATRRFSNRTKLRMLRDVIKEECAPKILSLFLTFCLWKITTSSLMAVVL